MSINDPNDSIAYGLKLNCIESWYDKKIDIKTMYLVSKHLHKQLVFDSFSYLKAKDTSLLLYIYKVEFTISIKLSLLDFFF